LQNIPQRGSILTKMGRLDEAHIELERVLARDPANEEANKLYVQIEPLQVSVREIRDFMASKNFQPALDRLSEVIEVRKIPKS
jgi:tetratricopeptide (TPR) repeat protein